MELIYYSREGVPLGLIERYKSLRWVRCYDKPGSFTLVCDASYAQILQPGMLLWPDSSPEAGVIHSRVVQKARKGQKTMTMTGSMISGLLGQRICRSTFEYTGLEEELLRKLVADNAISPSDTRRAIPGLTLGALWGATEQVEGYAAEHKVLTDLLSARCKASGLGYRVRFRPQDGGMVFEVYKGVDRSTQQIDRAPVVFGDDFDNLITAEYRDSEVDYCNAALVEGDTVNDTVTLVDVGDAQGLDLYETVLRANGVRRKQDDGTELTTAQYKKALAEYGKESLAEMQSTQAIDATILATEGALVFGVDWDLGDRVTLELPEWGLVVHKAVTQTEEVWEVSGYSLTPVFGEDGLTQIQKIERDMR